MTQSLTMTRPDDWHVHLRDGAMLRTVLPYTAAVFGRAIVMPNLRPPVVTTQQARVYRRDIMAALPPGSAFQPLMTVYLTDDTDPDDLERGYQEQLITAVKLYPAHATTNSEHGVNDLAHRAPVFERMQKIGLPLLVHGEVTDPEVDIFDREAVFIDTVMEKLRRDFPALKIVFEHITTKQAADYVVAYGETAPLAATITAHHLMINRNAMFKGGIRPHYYCLPVAKREVHRLALVEAATSGRKMFFLGTDTAPHAKHAKESACGCAGMFTAPNAMPCYAEVFDSVDKLSNLEAFASLNGPAFYQLPVNVDKITLTKHAPHSDEIKSILTADGQEIVGFAPLVPLSWHVSGGLA